LLQNKDLHDIEVSLFDEYGIGGGASGLAAGLMHPYNARSSLFAQGIEGLAATKQLLDIAAIASNKPVAEFSGLLKIPTSDKQFDQFNKCALNNPHDVTKYTEGQCRLEIPGLICIEGYFVHSGVTVNCPEYLMGLWKACTQLGAKLEIRKISQLTELYDYDASVLAVGGSTAHFAEIQHLNFKQLKGQIIELAWPSELTPLPFSLYSQAYIVMTPSKKSCLVGATFEREFIDSTATVDTAIKDLLPKAIALIPALEKADVINCQAGIRCTAPQHLPISVKITDKCWVIGGMGSKGLLFHGLHAKKISTEIMAFLFP